MLFVRELTNQEGQHLLRVARRNTSGFAVRRAYILLASAQKMKVKDIASLYHCAEDHVCDVIHAFNEDGLDCLKPNYRGGRPATFSKEERSLIIELAQIPPQTIGLPFSHWSLAKLAQAAMDRGIVTSITAETVRVILNEAHITYQNTKTWKQSNDPEFETKKNE
ncbi:helix-turn-helix domain-containing protein [Paenibacillus sp. A3]|uniref:helix-turn-helix domain-containing protein n=1 Tax=Paenibacillus sp. A3 TaxID=1337054 RepID=UPI0006D52EB4|nr:helix-turn-helix domain-containing protein [Paenibacillus sp. A3]